MSTHKISKIKRLPSQRLTTIKHSASRKIKHFLLVFDHDKDELVHEREFGTDIDSALEAYRAMEDLNKGNTRVEIVLIGSDSLSTVKKTHANYYAEDPAVSRFLVDL